MVCLSLAYLHFKQFNIWCLSWGREVRADIQEWAVNGGIWQTVSNYHRVHHFITNGTKLPGGSKGTAKCRTRRMSEEWVLKKCPENKWLWVESSEGTDKGEDACAGSLTCVHLLSWASCSRKLMPELPLFCRDSNTPPHMSPGWAVS